MVSDRNPPLITRQLLKAFAAELGRISSDAHKEVAAFALERIQPRVVSFEEQVALIRESLARVHESEESWTAAAQARRPPPCLQRAPAMPRIPFLSLLRPSLWSSPCPFPRRNRLTPHGRLTVKGRSMSKA